MVPKQIEILPKEPVEIVPFTWDPRNKETGKIIMAELTVELKPPHENDSWRLGAINKNTLDQLREDSAKDVKRLKNNPRMEVPGARRRAASYMDIIIDETTDLQAKSDCRSTPSSATKRNL